MATVIAEGEVTLRQAEEYLDAVVVADAMPYAKLVDCTNMVTHASDANRPVQICNTVAEAQAWLAQQQLPR